MEKSKGTPMSIDSFAQTIVDNPVKVLTELCHMADKQTKEGNTYLINQLVTAVQIVENDNKEKKNVLIQKKT